MATGVNIATAYISLIPTVQGLQGNIGQAFAPAQQEADAAGERSGKKFAVAAGAAIAASAAVVAAGLKKAYDVGAVFDDVSDTIRAGTGKSGAALEELSGIAKSVATTIPTSFEQAGTTVSQLSQRLGLTGNDLKTVSEQFLQAGAVLGKDVDIDSATKAFAAFGVQGDQVSTQMDTLFRVAQSTGVGMNELTAAAAAQAPALQQLGFGFQDTVALVGSLDKAGLNATAVTASLGKGLVKLAKDGEQPQQAFQRITGDISDLVSQGQTAQAIDLASGIFGTKGATQFVAAIQSGTLNMDQLNAAAAGTGDTILGVGEETADAAESWQLLKNKAMAALEPIGTAVFNLAGTGMGKLVEGFDKLNAKMQSDVIPTAKQMWDVLAKGEFAGGGALAEDSPIVDILFTIRDAVQDTFGEIFATLKEAWKEIAPPLMEAFKTIWDAVKPLIPTFLELFQAFNPVGLLFKAILPLLPQIAGVLGDLAKVLADGIAAALQAVAPLFQAVVGVINRLMPLVTQLIASLLPPFVALIEKLAPLFDAVIAALMPIVDAIVAALIPAIDALMPIVETVFGFIASTIENVMTVVGGLIDFLTGIFTGDWEKVWTGVKEIFGGIWDQIKNIFGTLWTLISEFFTNLAPRIWEIVSSFAGKLAEWGGQFLSWLWDGIKALAPQVFDWFLALPDWLWEKVSAAAGAMVERGKQFLQWLWDGITTKFEEVKTWFLTRPEALWSFISGAWQAVTQWGSDLINWIWKGTDGAGGIVGMWENVIQWFKDRPAALWTAIKDIWASATKWGGELVRYIIDGISGSDPYISAELAKTLINAGNAIAPGLGALLDISGVDVNKTIDEYIASLGQKRTGGLFGPVDGHGGGRIGVGTTGTADDVLIRGSRSEFMVNARDTARNLPWLEHINGGGQMPDYPGFAKGGLIGGMGSVLGATMVKKILPGIAKRLADAVTASLGTAVGGTATASSAGNNSYDPSSFGWTRGGQNIVGFSWNGTSISGGVANGTQGLWASLLSEVVPAIPGGITGPIWGYALRNIAGTSTPSFHSYGLAIDLNAPQNGRGLAGYGRSGYGVIPGDVAHNAAAKRGMQWGGDWGYTDPMHFEIHLSPDQIGGAAGSAGGGGFGLSGPLGSLFGAALAKLFGSRSSGSGGGGGGGSTAGVEQWRGLGLEVLSAVGAYRGMNLVGNIDRMLNQIRTESGGNPNAINNWDVNAQRGDPSIGLLQVIGSTFRNALRGTPFEYLIAAGQRDPRASMTASTLYSLNRYVSLERAWRGVAYDQGGWLMPGGQGINLLNKPEAVLRPDESQAYVRHAKAIALEDGFAGRTPQFNFNAPIQVRDEKELVHEMAWAVRGGRLG